MNQQSVTQERTGRIESHDGHEGLPAGPSRGRAIRWIALVVVILAAVAVMRGVNSRRAGTPPSMTRAPAGPPPAALVVTALPRVAPVQEAIEISGTIRTRQQVMLTPKIAEKIARILVDEGDRVTVGQLLIQLDDTALRAQVEQADAVLAGARARLAQTAAGKGVLDTAAFTRLQQAQADLDAARARLRQVQTRETLMTVESDTSVLQARNDLETAKTGQAQAAAQLASTKAQLENARARFARRDQLLRDGAISREDRDEAERAQSVAEANQNAAEEALQAARVRIEQAQTALDWARTNVQRKSISREDVEAARAQVAQAEAAVRAARANLAQTTVTAQDVRAGQAAVQQAQASLRIAQEQWRNTRIVAPVNGVVTRRMVNAGQAVGTNVDLLEVVALNDLYLEGQVSESEVAAIRTGMPVSVSVDSLPGGEKGGHAGPPLPGRIGEIIPLATEGSRTFRLRVRLPNTHGLKPGSFGRGRVVVRQTAGALMVPKTAVVDRDGQSVVYVAADGKAQRRPVQLGVATRDAVEVRRGLARTDRVVTRGAAGLTDGAPIETS